MKRKPRKPTAKRSRSRPKAARPATRSRPPVRSLQPSDAGELFTAQGFRLPSAVRDELRQAAGDLFWSLAADEQLIGEMPGPQAAVLRAVAEKFLQHGFTLAVCRYVRDLKRVPELREAYKQRSLKGNLAKRKQPRRRAGQTYTLDERDAAIVAEFKARPPRKSATAVQLDLADKYGLSDKQIRNILSAARKADRPETP
jgi:hypothetical protein